MNEEMLFGTVGNPISTPKKPGGSLGAIKQIRSLGLSALELGWVQSVRVTEETCNRIKQASIDEKVAISVHAPYYINLNASQEEWLKSRKRLMDAAYYGFLAGATDIIFHPGSYFNQNPSDVLRIAIPRLKDCAKELEENKIKVILRPETMGKSAMLGSLEDTLEMSKEICNVQPCLDFAHLHARPGDGTNNSRQEWEQVLDQYGRTLGKKALQNLHIHLSGIEYGSKGELKHLPIKESDFNLQELFHVLHDRGCSGRILCESPVLEEDAIYMKQLWESLF